MGVYQRKAQQNRVGSLCRFRPLPNPLTRVPRESFSDREWEIPLKVEISLINVNIIYKQVAYIHFTECLLCLLFLKNKEPKIILMPKMHILGWKILLPFIDGSFLRHHTQWSDIHMVNIVIVFITIITFFFQSSRTFNLSQNC